MKKLALYLSLLFVFSVSNLVVAQDAATNAAPTLTWLNESPTLRLMSATGPAVPMLPTPK
jgi:hypothetical protein